MNTVFEIDKGITNFHGLSVYKLNKYTNQRKQNKLIHTNFAQSYTCAQLGDTSSLEDRVPMTEGQNKNLTSRISFKKGGYKQYFVNSRVKVLRLQ